jgi:hypothetical protein
MPTLNKKITLFLLFISLSLAASAQIGNLKNKAKTMGKEKAKEEIQTENNTANDSKSTTSETAAPTAQPAATPAAAPASPVAAQPAAGKKNAPAARSASADQPVPPSDVELDFASQPFPPAIAWASLLDNESWYYNITNGQMYLNNLDVIFLPKTTTAGAAVNYAGYANKTPLLRMEVVDVATGTLKGTLHYEASASILPFYNMELLTGKNYKMSLNILEGKYEMRFFAGTKQFYTYPFSVEKKTNPDPYASVHDLYFLHGPWEEWGRVEFGPDNDFIFNFYLTDASTTITNQSVWDNSKAYEFLIKMYRDGKMVGAHRIQNVGNGFEYAGLQTRNGKWMKFDGTMYAYPVVATGSGAGSKKFLKKDELKDGNYTVDVLLKDQAGKESTMQYTFVVKGGAIQPDPKADRNLNKDPLTLLEQGPKFFYVKRVK